jgi:hypothetical protein
MNTEINKKPTSPSPSTLGNNNSNNTDDSNNKSSKTASKNILSFKHSNANLLKSFKYSNKNLVKTSFNNINKNDIKKQPRSISTGTTRLIRSASRLNALSAFKKTKKTKKHSPLAGFGGVSVRDVSMLGTAVPNDGLHRSSGVGREAAGEKKKKRRIKLKGLSKLIGKSKLLSTGKNANTFSSGESNNRNESMSSFSANKNKKNNNPENFSDNIGNGNNGSDDEEEGKNSDDEEIDGEALIRGKYNSKDHYITVNDRDRFADFGHLHWEPHNALTPHPCYSCKKIMGGSVKKGLRHHCRKCGGVVCTSCYKHKQKLKIYVDRDDSVKIWMCPNKRQEPPAFTICKRCHTQSMEELRTTKVLSQKKPHVFCQICSLPCMKKTIADETRFDTKFLVVSETLLGQ